MQNTNTFRRRKKGIADICLDDSAYGDVPRSLTRLTARGLAENAPWNEGESVEVGSGRGEGARNHIVERAPPPTTFVVHYAYCPTDSVQQYLEEEATINDPWSFPFLPL